MFCRLEIADHGPGTYALAVFRAARRLLEDVDHLLAIPEARREPVEASMNDGNINNMIEVSQLLKSQDTATQGRGSEAVDSTDISPLVLMAQLERLRESDPVQFTAVMSRFSSALGSESAAATEAADQIGKTFLTATRRRRWPIAMFSGAALVGVAMLMLMRPEHRGESKRAADTGNAAIVPATVARVFVGGREETARETEPSVAIAISGKTNADPLTALSSAPGALFAAKPPRAMASTLTPGAPKRVQQGAHRTIFSSASKKWSSSERWLAH
jgi:hypothetical protein